MPKNSHQQKKRFTRKPSHDDEAVDPREFYLLEKLYEAIRKDKSAGRWFSAREFYLMEKLYDAIRKDKELNHKPHTN